MKKIAADRNYRMLKRGSDTLRSSRLKEEAIKQVRKALTEAEGKPREERKRVLESFGVTETSIRGAKAFVVKLKGGKINVYESDFDVRPGGERHQTPGVDYDQGRPRRDPMDGPY